MTNMTAHNPLLQAMQDQLMKQVDNLESKNRDLQGDLNNKEVHRHGDGHWCIHIAYSRMRRANAVTRTCRIGSGSWNRSFWKSGGAGRQR